MRIGAQTSGLHVNYGLRAGAGRDEEFCRRLCDRLGVPLDGGARRAAGDGQPPGRRPGTRATRWPSGWPTAATTPPRTRLRPGRDRALPARGRRPAAGRCSAWTPRRGRLVRPLLEVTRERGARVPARALRSSGARTRRTPTPASRARACATSCCRRCASSHPAAEQTIAETARRCATRPRCSTSPSDALGPWAAARRCRSRRSTSCRGAPPPACCVASPRLAVGEPLRCRGGRPRRCSRSAPRARSARPRRRPAGGRRVRHAAVRRARERSRPPGAGRAPVPGSVRFGAWEVEARAAAAATWPCPQPGGPRLTVRGLARRRPDAPARAGRHEVAPGPLHRPEGPARAALQLPVVEAGDEIVWVAGVAVDERFAAPDGDEAPWASAARQLTP